MEAKKGEFVRFLLFPRTLDNTTYSNSSILVNGERKSILLYYGENFSDFGIRVTNMRCFQKMVNFFEQTLLYIIAPIESDNRRNVLMFGEILIVNREITKRWRESGWGLGLGFGIFGWSGMGTPFWG